MQSGLPGRFRPRNTPNPVCQRVDYSFALPARCYAHKMLSFRGSAALAFTVLAILLSRGFAQTHSHATAKATPNPSAAWHLTTNPPHLVNGTPVLLEVKPPAALKELSATWLGHSLAFAPLPDGRWFALAGVSLETKPGSYPLELQGQTANGKALATKEQLAVAAGKYLSVKLTVSKQFTEPSPEQLVTIKQDQEIKQKAFATASPDREWVGKFEAPVNAPISDVFGTKRVFNGETKSVHQGLDFRVPPGTPVAAVNAGTVILARPLYFEGNCVVVDHGQGLLTLYLHLSEFKVKEGDTVKRGQIVGLSGASGRATGPHLHIAVRWQGTYLDPAVLLRLPLPPA